MSNNHDCAYTNDGLRCPRLGVFCDSSRPETGKAAWWCNHHIRLINRGRTYHDKQLLIAMMDDVRDGRMPRGSTRIARPTDALLQAELGRLDLRRRHQESQSDFIERCKAKQKASPCSYGNASRRQLEQTLLLAGEDPSDALDGLSW